MMLCSRASLPDRPLRTIVENVSGVRVIRVLGEVDSSTVPRLRKVLARELFRRPAVLAVDLSELDFLGITGLDLLLRMHRVAEGAGSRLVLTGSPEPVVARLLGLVGWPVSSYPELARGDPSVCRPGSSMWFGCDVICWFKEGLCPSNGDAGYTRPPRRHLHPVRCSPHRAQHRRGPGTSQW